MVGIHLVEFRTMEARRLNLVLVDICMAFHQWYSGVIAYNTVTFKVMCKAPLQQSLLKNIPMRVEFCRQIYPSIAYKDSNLENYGFPPTNFSNIEIYIWIHAIFETKS